MRIKYDRLACNGWFQCVQEWKDFEMNTNEGKAALVGGEEMEDGTIVKEVPKRFEGNAKAAADSCPVDAIQVVTEDSES